MLIYYYFKYRRIKIVCAKLLRKRYLDRINILDIIKLRIIVSVYIILHQEDIDKNYFII